MLHDLLPGNVYYRFNPYLCDEFGLDEIREDRIQLMMEDTNLYIRKNDQKFDDAISVLNKRKNKINELTDWVGYQNHMWSTF